MKYPGLNFMELYVKIQDKSRKLIQFYLCKKTKKDAKKTVLGN
jgi:hypothetical protein